MPVSCEPLPRMYEPVILAVVVTAPVIAVMAPV